MKIETGWVNDDFMRDQFTMKVTLPKLIVTFKVKEKRGVSTELGMRLSIHKMMKRMKTIIASKATGYIQWREVI